MTSLNNAVLVNNPVLTGSSTVGATFPTSGYILVQNTTGAPVTLSLGGVPFLVLADQGVFETAVAGAVITASAAVTVTTF